MFPSLFLSLYNDENGLDHTVAVYVMLKMGYVVIPVDIVGVEDGTLRIWHWNQFVRVLEMQGR